ncbi:MAG: PIN domain-containing protein [gamma proteobacterium symbiont of Bathyaustriella thionipta]|nr:PIN domain-containing protein [gamma proteobacterium symbiont of Bathyaustriella thionipta]
MVFVQTLLNREAFVDESAQLLGMVEHGVIEGYLCATTLTSLDYLMAKATNKVRAKVGVRRLLTLFRIAEVNARVLEMAIDSSFDDFEDAVQYHAGMICSINGLVTRNPRDYRNADLPVYLPAELLAVMSLGEK